MKKNCRDPDRDKKLFPDQPGFDQSGFVSRTGSDRSDDVSLPGPLELGTSKSYKKNLSRFG